MLQVDPSKFMVMISSNGYQTTPDLSNRSSIIRINKRSGYAFQTWAPGGIYKGGMREFIQDAQPLILSSVFSIVREWHRQGKPRTQDTRHDFRDWCQILDWIVQNIFHEAPLMDGHQAAQARVTNPDHTFLRLIALTLTKVGKLSQPLRAGELAELCEEQNLYIPGVSKEKAHDEKNGATLMGKVMKRVFGEKDSVIVDIFTITKTEKKVGEPGFMSYPTSFYTFHPPVTGPSRSESGSQ